MDINVQWPVQRKSNSNKNNNRKNMAKALKPIWIYIYADINWSRIGKRKGKSDEQKKLYECVNFFPRFISKIKKKTNLTNEISGRKRKICMNFRRRNSRSKFRLYWMLQFAERSKFIRKCLVKNCECNQIKRVSEVVFSIVVPWLTDRESKSTRTNERTKRRNSSAQQTISCHDLTTKNMFLVGTYLVRNA